VGWSLLAICAILALTFLGVPLLAGRLTVLVPAAIENRIGEAVDKQMRTISPGRVCTEANGQAAPGKLLETLRRAGSVEPEVQAIVLRQPIPNAFAVLGGSVYVMSGLLDKAPDADGLAGMLAHELGHVKHHDGLRKIIQKGASSFLIGLLFGDFTGAGVIVFAGRALFDSAYTRDVEASADAFAIALMHRLGRSTTPMGELLFSITGAEANGGLSLLASHPPTEERLAHMRSADRAPGMGAELLSASEWEAAKNICAY